MSTVPKEISEYMRELGRKGGAVKSERKAKAAKRNGKRNLPRKKQVDNSTS